jgi:hypothetical protein
VDPARNDCAPDAPVFGELVSLIRYPFKIYWAGDRLRSIHDLSWDPWERSDLSRTNPEMAKALGEELAAFVKSNVLNRKAVEPTKVDADTARALKALGYVD